MNKEILPVIDEITAVLEKHGMTGFVIVGNRSHCDWRIKVDAPWSCAKTVYQDGAYGIRIVAKRADYPSDEVQKQTIQDTIGMFVTMEHILAQSRQRIEELLLGIAKHVAFDGKSITEE